MAERVSSPNSPGASATSELAKRGASDYSRQMPNLNLITDPFIYELSRPKIGTLVQTVKTLERALYQEKILL